MHKLIEYICDELEELERKADKENKLSMAEIQYADTLAHLKKNLLKAEMMEDGEYSNARGRKRDSMGRYSSRGDVYITRRDKRYMDPYTAYSRDDSKQDIREELEELENMAKDEETKHMIKKWIKQLEQG